MFIRNTTVKRLTETDPLKKVLEASKFEFKFKGLNRARLSDVFREPCSRGSGHNRKKLCGQPTTF